MSSNEELKAISIKQPLARMVIDGYKDVVNRSWTTSYRGTLLIHASKQIHDDDQKARYLLAKQGEFLIPTPNLVKGSYIGTVELVDIIEPHETYHSNWYDSSLNGFILENPRKFDEPVKGNSSTKIYSPSYSREKILREKLSR